MVWLWQLYTRLIIFLRLKRAYLGLLILDDLGEDGKLLQSLVDFIASQDKVGDYCVFGICY